MALVSIIMCVYNEKEEWLRQSIESILNQEYTKFEFIIVLDNPENLEAKKIINEYLKIDSRIVFIENELNIGLIKSLNKALKITKGKYIARMDADDISIENRIRVQIEFLENNRNVDLISSNMKIIDEDNNEIKTTRLKNNNLHYKLIFENPFYHPTWFFKKSILDKIVCYRNIEAAEDYDFICRCIVKNINCRLIEEPLLLYRVRDNSITRTKKIRQMYETERIKKAFIKQSLLKKDYLERLECGEIKLDQYRRFDRAIYYLNKFKSSKNLIIKTTNLFKSVLIYPDRISLKLYMIIFKILKVRSN